MYTVGQKVHIIYMDGESSYSGRTGVITHIDDMGQLHGTWGGLALNPKCDDFEIIGNSPSIEDEISVQWELEIDPEKDY